MPPPSPQRLLRVALVDDKPAARALTSAAFEPCADIAHLQALSHPPDTLTWLAQQARRGTLPDVLLLDLNMPDICGLSVLQAIRASPSLTRMRVIMLSISGESAGVNASYALGATSYLIKPGTFRAFEEQMRTVITYWHSLFCVDSLSRAR